MSKMSEEEVCNGIIHLDQEDNTFQLPSDPNQNNDEDRHLKETELNNKPPNLVNKEICLHSNHDQFGIIKLGTVPICLVCKTVIHISGLDSCYENHLNSNEHKLYQLELFKECFNCPGFNGANKIYNYISNNSVIDFSSTTEISTDKVSLICVVCKHAYPVLKTFKNSLVEGVLHHLKDVKHFRNVKDNLSWTCNLLSGGYMVFYKTLFYCSECEESISCYDNHLIRTAVEHLKAKHHEYCKSHGLEEESICSEEEISQDSDSIASDKDPFEDNSDDLYLTCGDESFHFDDKTTSSIPEVNTLQIQKEQIVEVSTEMHPLCHDVEKGDSMHNSCASQVFPSPEINVQNSSLAKSDSEHFALNEQQNQVLISQLSVQGAVKNIPEGHTNQNYEQANTEQQFLTKTKDDIRSKYFADLSDCLPANFHTDLGYVSIKSNRLHCELCNCSLGVDFNVFESSIILNSHFSSIFHRSQMDAITKVRSENKLKTSKGSSNYKQEEKSYVNSHVKEDRFTLNNEMYQIKSVPLGNVPTLNGSSSNFVAEAKCNYFNKTDFNPEVTLNTQKTELLESYTSSMSLTVQEHCDSDSISNNHISEATKQATVLSNNCSGNNKLFYLPAISSESLAVKNQTEVNDISINIPVVHTQQTEVQDSSQHQTEVQDTAQYQTKRHDTLCNIPVAHTQQTEVQDTSYHQTEVQDTSQHQTEVQDTSEHQTEVQDTSEHQTEVQDAAQYQSEVHNTLCNIPVVHTQQTELQDTSQHQTEVHDTSEHQTEVQDTSEHQTEVQDTSQHQTEVHDTSEHQTEVKVVPNSSLLLLPKHPNTHKEDFITDLLKDSKLKIHQEFFKRKLNKIFCCLCSTVVSKNEAHLKDHITGLTHKVQFLSQLKKSLKESKKNQVRFLIFMNGQLFCSICKCYIDPWNNFTGICQGVKDHFKKDAHSAVDKDKTLKSGEICQAIISKNVEAIVEGKTHFDFLHNKQTEAASVTDENKQKIINDLRDQSKSCEVLVETPPKSSKVFEANNSFSSSGLNVGTTLNKLDLKPTPVKEFVRDFQTSKSTSSVVGDNFAGESSKLCKKPHPSFKKVNENNQKMDLALKRLISTASLVRVNKDYIEQKGENFNCILCSKCIPYSPQKYVLANNLNLHFKSATHVAIANQISKQENISKISQIVKRNNKETCRPTKNHIPKTTSKKSFIYSSCDNLEVKKCNPIKQPQPNEGSENNGSKLNLTNPKHECRKVRKQLISKEKVSVSMNKTSALKRFIKKYEKEKGLNLFEYNLNSNKSSNQQLHPLLQKLAHRVPLLEVNKQYIIRKSIDFHCTLCCKDILFTKENHVLATFIDVHLKSKTHTTHLETEISKVECEHQTLVKRSTSEPSKTNLPPPNCTENKTENRFCNILTQGNALFKDVYLTLIKFQNEELFFCNHCMKLKKTITHKSFEHAIIQHCLKVHKGPGKKNDIVIASIVWINNVLRANVSFVEMARQAAACVICSEPVPFSKNYNLLIFNFLKHFQDEKHKRVVRSTKHSNIIQCMVGEKSKKYKPNLNAYEANPFD